MCPGDSLAIESANPYTDITADLRLDFTVLALLLLVLVDLSVTTCFDMLQK
jgi:hypothetical protein